MGWSSSYWGNLKPTFTYPVAGNGGGKAAKVGITHWSSGDARWEFSRVPVSAHTIYQFSDDYNSDVVTTVAVQYSLSNGSNHYLWLGNAEPTRGSWKTFSAQITVPKGAVSMTVLHALDKNGSLTIDNAYLIGMPPNPFPRGMVTLVFDDGRASQFKNARPILNSAGLKSTYAIITQPQRVRDPVGRTAFMSWANIDTLNTEGNEIAAHTRTHRDLTTLTFTQARAEISGSYRDLIAHGFTPTIFVYPYGSVTSMVVGLVRSAGFMGARGSYFGLNVPTADTFNLHDIRVDKGTSVVEIDEWIDQAIADKRWLILELHDVLGSGGDDYAITPAKLQDIVSYIKQAGIRVVTLQEGMQLVNH